MLEVDIPGADLGGGCRGAHPLPPPRDDLRLSNATGILQNKSVTPLISFPDLAGGQAGRRDLIKSDCRFVPRDCQSGMW